MNSKFSSIRVIGMLFLLLSSVLNAEQVKVVFPKDFADTGLKKEACKVRFTRVIPEKNGKKEALSSKNYDQGLKSKGDDYVMGIPAELEGKRYRMVLMNGKSELTELTLNKKGELHVPYLCKVKVDASSLNGEVFITLRKVEMHSHIEYFLNRRLNHRYLFRYVPVGEIHVVIKDYQRDHTSTRKVMIPKVKEFHIKLSRKSVEHVMTIETTPETPSFDRIHNVNLANPRIMEWMAEEKLEFQLVSKVGRFPLYKHRGKTVCVLPSDFKKKDLKELRVNFISVGNRGKDYFLFRFLDKVSVEKDGSLSLPKYVIANINMSYLVNLNKIINKIDEEDETDEKKIIYVSRFIRTDDRTDVRVSDFYEMFSFKKESRLIRPGEYITEVLEFNSSNKSPILMRPPKEMRLGIKKGDKVAPDYFHKDISSKFTIPDVDEVNLVFNPSVEKKSMWSVERVKKKK